MQAPTSEAPVLLRRLHAIPGNLREASRQKGHARECTEKGWFTDDGIAMPQMTTIATDHAGGCCCSCLGINADV